MDERVDRLLGESLSEIIFANGFLALQFCEFVLALHVLRGD
jgi:hypothetical protein